MQIAIHGSQNLIFKAFADDDTWLQLFMHIQKNSTLQNIGMLNPTCPSTRLLPCFLPATSPAVHTINNSTEVKNVFFFFCLTAGDCANWVVYRLVSILNKDSNVPGSDSISEILKGLDPQCKEILGIDLLSQDWNSEPGMFYALEALEALHVEQSVFIFIVGDTWGAHPSCAEIQVIGFREIPPLPSVQVRTPCRHQSESFPV